MGYMAYFKKTVDYLKEKDKILFITTSNRWKEEKDLPKSSLLAEEISKAVGFGKIKIIDASKLQIYPCEGNISGKKGNTCGVTHAVLQDTFKNPSGCHRCWASINNPDDELWQISKEIFNSEVVLFFGSVRWGQMNSIYQKLIERLSWIENRHTTLKEENVIKNIDSGLICVGQNWNGKNVIKLQKNVLGFFGFKTPKDLFWNWQYTSKVDDESEKSYENSYKKFKKDFRFK